MSTMTASEMSELFRLHMPGVNVEINQYVQTHEIEVKMRYGIFETLCVPEILDPQRQGGLLEELGHRIQDRAFIDLGLEEGLHVARREQLREDVSKLKKRIQQLRESAETTLVPGAREVYYAQMGTMSEAIEILERVDG